MTHNHVVTSADQPMRMLVPLRMFQTSLDHGNMTLHVPAQVTEADIKDIEELLPLYLRVIRRWRTSITIPTDDTPSGWTDGAALIAAERKRQKSVEGWTPEHDDDHRNGEMATAAACYIKSDGYVNNPPDGWPWHIDWWKPSPNNRVRELVKAGALIAAEIDRLQRINR